MRHKWDVRNGFPDTEKCKICLLERTKVSSSQRRAGVGKRLHWEYWKITVVMGRCHKDLRNVPAGPCDDEEKELQEVYLIQRNLFKEKSNA